MHSLHLGSRQDTLFKTTGFPLPRLGQDLVKITFHKAAAKQGTPQEMRLSESGILYNSTRHGTVNKMASGKITLRKFTGMPVDLLKPGQRKLQPQDFFIAEIKTFETKSRRVNLCRFLNVCYMNIILVS